MVAGGSYGGFIALEYAVRYPGRVSAIVLRDTSADGSNLELAFENARNQDRVEIHWERFNRYWHGEIRDDADLKQLLGELIPLYDYEYDPERSAAAVEAGIYRHEAHNWCFQHNWGATTSRPTAVGDRPDAGHRRPLRLGHPGQLRRRRSPRCCRTPSWWSSRTPATRRRTRSASCSRPPCAGSVDRVVPAGVTA